MKRITLKEAIKFHGHLGPYLILGILAGNLALKELRCKKHFGINIKVWGANKKPESCLIDGLQLSTGATYGKGNIHKLNSRQIKILVSHLKSNKAIEIFLQQGLINRLEKLKGHSDSETFAKKIFKINPKELFDFNL